MLRKYLKKLQSLFLLLTHFDLNYNHRNPKYPVAVNLFTQKDVLDALEKAERRIKREKKIKEKHK